jgi:elongation factor Ts
MLGRIDVAARTALKQLHSPLVLSCHQHPKPQPTYETPPKYTMPTVTSAMVKELKQRIDAGMMECKKALTEADGNIENAYEALKDERHVPRPKEIVDGVVAVHTGADYGSIVEVHCQTDFVAKEHAFISFVDKLAKAAYEGRIANIEELERMFEEEQRGLSMQMHESIGIRRVAALEGENLAGYTHRARVATLVSTTGVPPEMAKQIAMHVAAMKPEYLTPADVPADVMEDEYKRQLRREIESGRSKATAENAAKRYVTKLTLHVSLTGQSFVVDTGRTVGEVLKTENAQVLGFVRYEVGEAAQFASK